MEFIKYNGISSVMLSAVYSKWYWCPMVFSVVLSLLLLLLLSIWKITAHHQNEKWDVSRILIQFYCLSRMEFIKMGIETCTFTEWYWRCCCCCCHCVYYLLYNNSSSSNIGRQHCCISFVLFDDFSDVYVYPFVVCHPNDQLLPAHIKFLCVLSTSHAMYKIWASSFSAH